MTQDFKQDNFFHGIESYRPIAKERVSKKLYVNIEPISKTLQENHSAEAYFITFGVGSNSNMTIEQEWFHFGQIFQELIQTLFEKFFISGILVGFEMYSKNKGRRNTKALRPHAHMVLYTYNSFLQLPLAEIKMHLNRFMNDIKIDHLRKSSDMARAACYSVKSSKKDLIREACQHFFNAPSVSLYINNTISNNPLNDLPKVLENQKIDCKVYKDVNILKKSAFVDSVDRFQGDEKLQIAEYVKQICLSQNIAIYKDQIFSQNAPSKFTWYATAPQSRFIAILTDHLDFPSAYKRQMYNNADWILNEGSKSGKKSSPIQTIFPRLSICPHLWEFKNHLIYNFETGKNAETVLDPFISCSKYHDFLWSDLPSPEPVIKLVNFLVKNNHSEFEQFMSALGTLFHPLKNRKAQPAVWLWGASTTFKTAFLKKFFQYNFNEMLITYVQHSRQTQFKYGRLQGITEGILYIDEYRDVNFERPAELLNITDGLPVILDEKYQQPTLTEFKGHPVITSNQSIAQTNHSPQDQEAIQHRFTQTQFEIKQGDNAEVNRMMENIKPNQWVSFGIYSNIIYLTRSGRNFSDLDIPDQWKDFVFDISQKEAEQKKIETDIKKREYKDQNEIKISKNSHLWKFDPFIREKYLERKQIFENVKKDEKREKKEKKS